jgi:hypothetical protein
MHSCVFPYDVMSGHGNSVDTHDMFSLCDLVLVTVLPFFHSRVLGSPFAGTFSSYLLIVHNFSEFLFLAHATVVSKSVGQQLTLLPHCPPF